MGGKSIQLCGEDLHEPGHICGFFTSQDEEYDTLIPYVKDGIDAGEEVLNVLDEARLAEHRERLEANGVSTTDGRLQLASSEDTYLAGGRFDMERMAAFVRGTLVAAADRGRRVRTAGWMDWMQRDAPGTDRAIEYESRMNLLVSSFGCTFICVYDLAKVDGTTMADIMATHPYVILRGRIRQNPFYVPPETYLRELLERFRKRDPSASPGA